MLLLFVCPPHTCSDFLLFLIRLFSCPFTMGKLFRVSFDFESAAEAQSAFFSIISGKKNILDYLNKYSSETIRKEDFLKALKKEIKPGA